MTTIISITLLVALLAIDPSVPEFTGDLRWRLLQITALMWGGWLAWRAATDNPAPTWRTTREMLIAWLLLAWMGITSWASVCQAESLRTWANVAAGVGLFTLAGKFSDDRMFRRFQIVITIVLAVNVVIGLLQVWPGITFIPQAAPPAGLMSNCNLLASLIVATLPVAVSVAGWWVTIPALMMLYLIGSRAGYIAVAALLAWWSAMLISRSGFRCLFRAYSISLAAGAAILMSCYVTGRVRTDSDMCRIAFNVNSVRILLERPITGFGPGTFGAVYRAYQEPLVESPHGQRGEWPRRCHNDWLQIALEAGVPALMMYAWLFCSWLRMAAATRRAWPLGGGLLGLGVCALFDFPLQLPVGQALFWLYGGLITHAYWCVGGRPIRPRIRWGWIALILAIMAAATAAEIVNVRHRVAEQAKVTYDNGHHR